MKIALSLLALLFLSTVSPLSANPIFRVLARFNLTSTADVILDAPLARALAAPIQGRDGNFYGTVSQGGTHGLGGVYRMTPTGVLTLLASFDGRNGAKPVAGLVMGHDGNFYGVTSEGGEFAGGTLFRLTPYGHLTTLIAFDVIDGGYPLNTLTVGPDGELYGTTSRGGDQYCGTIFKSTLTGEITTLVTLNIHHGQSANSLLWGGDGYFYGTTSIGTTRAGGDNGTHGGTFFRMTPEGVLTTLTTFPAGSSPRGPLALGVDGNFYGTTLYGGNDGRGTLYRVTHRGLLTTLVSFKGETNGELPSSGVTLARDGNLYGTTNSGTKPLGLGSVFRYSAAGIFTTVVSFSDPNGRWPVAGLTLGTDGNLYGVTSEGYHDNGVVYELKFSPQ